MRIYMVHYHLRPGGVRRVMDMLMPAVLRHGGADRLILASGEAPDAAWLAKTRHVMGVPVEVRVRRPLGYIAEQPEWPDGGARRLSRAVREVLRDAAPGDVIWLQNPLIGRNHAAIRAFSRQAAARKCRLVFHHHDFWMDGRWSRWTDIRRCGVRSVAGAARVLDTGRAPTVHLAINRRDASALVRRMGPRAQWLPDPLGSGAQPNAAAVREARRWLLKQTVGTGRLWVAPCRLLRRKNLAESLLIMRWLHPDATLLTTAGVTSIAEKAYANALEDAAERHHWPLRLGVLSGRTRAPGIDAIMAAADVLVMTSIQEGFGLPYIEAARAERPLVCRLLPHVTDDLARLGLRFPAGYSDIVISTDLFDADAEQRRQARRFAAWRSSLPRALRHRVRGPDFAASRAEAVFSRLTLAAQLEVLAHPPEITRTASLPLNPWLTAWCGRPPTPMRCPARLLRALDPARLAAQWWRAVRTAVPVGSKVRLDLLQDDLMRMFLAHAHEHPLLWTSEP